jgi:hypothetical protein
VGTLLIDAVDVPCESIQYRFEPTSVSARIDSRVAPGVVSSTSPPAVPELDPDELLDDVPPELEPLLLVPDELPELLAPLLLAPLLEPPPPVFPLDVHAAGSHTSATATAEKTAPRPTPPTPRKARLFILPGAALTRSVSRATYRPAQGPGIMRV